MSRDPRIRVARALDLLPETEDLLPLRAAIVETAVATVEPGWTASELYRSLGSREADAARLVERVAALAEEGRVRAEKVYLLSAQAVQLASAEDLEGAARSLVAAGEVEEKAGRLNLARSFYERAREVGRGCRERRVEGLAARRLGRIARAVGRLSDAETLYRESFTTAEAESDAEGVVVACQGLGNVAADREQWDEALRWYEIGLEAWDPSLSLTLLWQLQINLSVVGRKRGDLAASREWVELARQTIASASDDWGVTYLSNAEGLLLEAEGDRAGAEALFRTALLSERGSVERATLLVNLADSLARQTRHREALGLLRELEDLAIARSLHSFLPYVYRALGRIATSEGDEDGFVFFEQALEVTSRGPGLPHEDALTQREYARFELRFDRFEAAEARFAAAEDYYRQVGAPIPANDVAKERAAVLERLGRLPGAEPT